MRRESVAASAPLPPMPPSNHGTGIMMTMTMLLLVAFSFNRKQRERKLGMLLERHDEWPGGSERRSERAIVKMVVDSGPAQVRYGLQHDVLVAPRVALRGVSPAVAVSTSHVL